MIVDWSARCETPAESEHPGMEINYFLGRNVNGKDFFIKSFVSLYARMNCPLVSPFLLHGRTSGNGWIPNV